MRKIILFAFVIWGIFTIFSEEKYTENTLAFD